MGPWARLHAPSAEVFSVVWESKQLVALGRAIENLVRDQVVSFAMQEALKQTILAGVLAAAAFPLR